MSCGDAVSRHRAAHPAIQKFCRKGVLGRCADFVQIFELKLIAICSNEF